VLDLHAAQDQLTIVFVLAAGDVDHAQGVGHADRAGDDLADIVEPHRLEHRLHDGSKTLGLCVVCCGIEFLQQPLGEHLLGADAGACADQRRLVRVYPVDDIGEVFADADCCCFNVCT
jgi:hypothetical protein